MGSEAQWDTEGEPVLTKTPWRPPPGLVCPQPEGLHSLGLAVSNHTDDAHNQQSHADASDGQDPLLVQLLCFCRGRLYVRGGAGGEPMGCWCRHPLSSSLSSSPASPFHSFPFACFSTTFTSHQSHPPMDLATPSQTPCLLRAHK